jgi:hypothetical protein
VGATVKATVVVAAFTVCDTVLELPVKFVSPL